MRALSLLIAIGVGATVGGSSKNHSFILQVDLGRRNSYSPPQPPEIRRRHLPVL